MTSAPFSTRTTDAPHAGGASEPTPGANAPHRPPAGSAQGATAIGELARTVWRRKGTIAAVTLVAAALALGAVSIQTPTYRATATLLLEQDRPGGLLGDLAALASLSSAPTASSELSVLESRTLAATVVASPEPGRAARPGLEGYDRSLGLTTMVEDESLTPLTLLRRQVLGEAAPGRPPIHPDGRLFAHVRRDPSAEVDDVPNTVRVSFLGPDRIAVSSPSLLSKLLVAEDYETELDYVPGRLFRYRGLEITLEHVGDVSGGRFLVRRLAEYEAIGRLMRRTGVREVTRNSGVISVSVTDTDPFRAAETANALCNNYLESLSSRSQRRALGTIDYIKSLIQEQEKSFDQALEDILALRKEHPETLDISIAAQTILDRLSNLELQRVELELRRHAMTEVVEALRGGDATALGRLDAAMGAGLVVDPLTEGMLAEMAELEQTFSLYAARYQEGEIPLLETRETIDLLEGRILAQLESRLAGMGSLDSQLSQETARILESLSGLPDTERELATPLLAIEAHKEVLPFLFRSLQGAEIAQTSAELSADFIDRAEPPTKLHRPGVLVWLVLGTLLGLFGGFVTAFLTEPRRGTLRTREELEAATGQKALGVVPHFQSGRIGAPRKRMPIPLRDAADHPAAEAYRTVYAALGSGATETPPTAIGITSTARREGRSTAAIDLALAVSQTGGRVLLVDADLRQPVLHRELDRERAPGLSNHLSSDADWREMVQATEHEGLGLLSAGTAVDAPGRLLAGGRMQELLKAARLEYDAVVLDLPPATGIADVFVVGHALDALVFVHRAGRARRGQVVACAENLWRNRLPVLGTLLNAAPRREAF